MKQADRLAQLKRLILYYTLSRASIPRSGTR